MTNPVAEDGAAAPVARTGLPEHLLLGCLDLVRGARAWRVWGLLGLSEIWRRYARSRIGQFWMTLSIAVTIASLGLVYSHLLDTPIEAYLPFLALGFIIWAFISGTILQGCQAFTSADRYLKQSPLPRSVFVYRVLFEHLVVLAHNIVVLPPLYLILGIPVPWTAVVSLFGLLLVTANLGWMVLLLATVCARFRDFPQMVASLLQVAFFVTPVLWHPDQISGRLRIVIDLNPFAALLAVVRDPLLGTIPGAWTWGFALLLLVFGYGVALPFFARFRARVVYWL